MNATYIYPSIFLWGIAVLVAYAGFGRALTRSIAPSLVDRVGWGLLSVWGMGIVLLIGGVLLATSSFSVVSVDLIVALGIGLLCIDVVRSPPNRPGDSSFFTLSTRERSLHYMTYLPWVFLLVYYAGSIAWLGETDRNDDLVSYFAFPKIMLQTGTFHDSFGFRRMTTYGGQPFLQALSARFGSEVNYHFADCGLARVLLFGLVSGLLRPIRKSSPLPYSLLLCTILILPIPRNNTTSELIHAVLLLAVPLTLLEAIKLAHETSGCRQRVNELASRFSLTVSGTALCALVIFAASTFRPHIGLTAALLFATGLFALTFARQPAPSGAIPALTTTAIAGVMTFAMLLPWAVMLYRSSGTVAFPPFRGNLSLAFSQMHANSGSTAEVIRSLFDLVFRIDVLSMLIPLVLLSLRASNFIRAIALSAISLTFFTAYASTALSFPYFYRYVWPIPFAAMLFIGCKHVLGLLRHAKAAATREQTEGISYKRRSIAVLTASFALAAFVFLPKGMAYIISVAQNIPEQVLARPFPLRRNHQAIYEQAQQQVPPGESILAMTDLPFLFDHSRNKILTIDAPGALSPDGNMPFYQGHEETRRYLQSLGIHYVAYTPTDVAILQYRRKYWEHNPRPEAFYQNVWAPPMLDLMNAFAFFRETSPILFQHRRLEVLSLNTAAERNKNPAPAK